MKQLLFIALIMLPLISFGQSRKKIRNQRREKMELYRESRKKYRKMKPSQIFKSKFDLSGYYMTQSSGMMVGGLAAEIAGGGIIAGGASSNSIEVRQACLVGGGAIVITGLVLQIIGITKIGKAGNALQMTNKGISFSF